MLERRRINRAARNQTRAAFFFEQAAQSVRLAQTSPTRKLKRMWLEQAFSELERAMEARGVCNA